MMPSRVAVAVVLAITALLPARARVSGQTAPDWLDYPDLIIHNAKIVTVDEEFSIAEAAAIRDGRFVAVGPNSAILRQAGPGTRRVDLGGKTVLPGFHDSHVDIMSVADDWVLRVDLTEVGSIAEIQAALAERAARTEPGEWILGSRGWWEYELSDGRLPTKHDLDDATPEHPACIPGPHYWICNSRALEIGGITRDTPDPPAGEIWHDEAGETTGLLMDEATDLVGRYFPESTREQKLEGMRQLMKRVNANGMTSYREPGGSVEQVRLLRELYDNGELTIRVDWAYSVDPNLPQAELDAAFEALGPPGQSFGDGMFRADGIAEVGLDGAEQTAFLRADYPDRPGYRGIQKFSQETYDRLAETAARHGWRLGPHAVGDAAIDEVIAAYHHANLRTPITDRRWMIDHAFLLLPDHYQDVKDLGLIINSQYMHNYQLGKLILAAWKLPLAHMSERFRDWVDNGILFANGSDGPISYHERPILYIYGAITRNTAWGGRLGPDQGLSREEAIRSVTSNSAHTSFEEHVKGSIEPGKYADFVVLSDDLLTIPVEDIKDIEVLATVLGGEVVYGSLEE